MADNRNDMDLEASEQESAFPSQDDGASTETWQDELPPEDDFHDHDDGVEELIDEIQDDASVTPPPADGNKRGKAVLLGALVVGALFIGGLAYLQFAGTESGGGPMIPLGRVLDTDNLDKMTMPDAPEPMAAAVVGQGQSNAADIKNLYDVNRIQSENKTALPTGDVKEVVTDKPMEAMSSQILDSTAESKTATALPPVPQPEPHVVKTETIPMPRVDDLMPKQEAAPQAGQLLPVQAQKTDKQAEAKIASLTTQLEALQKSFDQVMQKNEELLAKVDTLTKDQTASSGQEQSLQSRISDLEKQLGEKDKAMKDALSKTASVASKPVPEKVLVQTDDDEPAAVKAPVTKKAPARSARKPAAMKKPAVAWVLRAATPDAAWVSQGRESQDLRRVAVGESLDSIGRVTAIKQNGDKWEVVGSKGTLR